MSPLQQVSTSLLDIPPSGVNDIVAKWKRLATTATQRQSFRPCEVHIGLQLAADSTAAERQTFLGINIGTKNCTAH